MKTIHKTGTIHIQSPVIFVVVVAKIEKSTLKFIECLKGPHIAKTILKNKKRMKLEISHILISNLSQKVTVMKNSMVLA